VAVILALRKLKWEDHMFESTLGYIARSCLIITTTTTNKLSLVY
jgi:hypothetical protein